MLVANGNCKKVFNSYSVLDYGSNFGVKHIKNKLAFGMQITLKSVQIDTSMKAMDIGS